MTNRRRIRATSTAAIGAVLVAVAAVLGWPVHAVAQVPDYAALWASGATYDEFAADVSARRSLWARNTARAEVAPAVLARARSVPGEWKLLVIAFDRCSDSVNTIPYLAALADRVDGLALRIVPPESGEAVMDAHRTPDGRTATPTVLLLDDDWQPHGAWVERPSELQAWYIANPENLTHDQRYFEKMGWYREDAGASTIAEVVALLVRAGRERP